MTVEQKIIITVKRELQKGITICNLLLIFSFVCQFLGGT